MADIPFMLHIVFISPHCDPQANLGEPDSGGQCVYEHQLAMALSALPDIKVTTYCRQTFRRPDVSKLSNSYEIHRIHTGRPNFIPKEEIERVIGDFSFKVHQKIKAKSADTTILHAHYWDGGQTALRLKSLSDHKLPLVWTPHSLGTLKRQKFQGETEEFTYNFIPRLTWEAYTSMVADKIIVSSIFEKETVASQYAVSPDKVEVLPPGVDFSNFDRVPRAQARQTFKFPARGKILLCLGRMTPTKGYQYAIAALASLQKKYSQPVYLVICGGSATQPSDEESKYLKRLHDVVIHHNLEDRVIFHPAVAHDQINTLFSAADIFLMPSEHEPFGLVTIEAMGMKVPVVASNQGGPAAIILHNQTGTLVDFHHPERVANYIVTLFKDPEFYQKICLQAHKYAHHSYDWYHKAAEFAQIYRQVSRRSHHEIFQEWISDKYFLQQYFATTQGVNI